MSVQLSKSKIFKSWIVSVFYSTKTLFYEILGYIWIFHNTVFTLINWVPRIQIPTMAEHKEIVKYGEQYSGKGRSGERKYNRLIAPAGGWRDAVATHIP